MKRLVCLILMFGPVALMGQKKEDILAIQRDVAILQDQVKQLQKSQDDRLAGLQSMLQQTVDVSKGLSSGLQTMQRDVDQKLNDQQTKLVAPVATLGTKVDQMSDDFRSVATNVAELVRRMSALDAKLADISNAIRTLSAPPAAPPAAVGVGSNGQITTQVPGASGASAETSYNNAYRDYSSGKNELALQEFAEYVKSFPDTADAPNAQFYIGYIYFNGGANYADAAKAFDDVVMRWPENPKSADAMYYKAVSLQKDGQRTAAVKGYKDFIAKYPHHDKVDQAHKNLRTLGMDTPSSSKRRN